ncbi:MAG: two-component regulator propeller domain-containing protein, partial [Bacteroidota bacterium]
LEDSRHNLWICTDGGGLNYFNRATETFTYYKALPDPNHISGNNVKSLYLQGDSILWIGTHRAGLNKFTIRTGQFEHHMFDMPLADSARAPEVRAIIKYGDDLLIGTSAGLLRFDLQTEGFSFFLPAKLREEGTYSVISLWQDDQQEVWFGTEKSGLFKYNATRQTLKGYRGDRTQPGSLPSDFIYAIFKDQAKRIWIGTSDGLSQYIPEADSFKSYYREDGLSGNTIFGIVESRFSGLVVETDKGISYFNPETGSFRNVTFANGLPLKELSPSGILNTSNGYLIVSGIEGMVIFDEMDFLNQKPQTHPRITGLLVNNQPITPNQSPDIIAQTIMLNPPVNLGHQHASITFSISDMSFIASNRQGLEYKLEGFDEKWIEAGDRHNISYTNLDDGNYTFYVRSINAPEFMSALPLKMSPPFYLSDWAIFLYTISGVGLFLLINFQYVRQSKLAYNLAAEKEHHLRDEELNQKKINFFTNISHEFRTPLTLMAGQLEILLENPTFGPNTYKKLLSVQKNTVRLRNLISELLNFRKLEQGKLELKVKSHDFIVFIREIHASFTELA